MLKFILPILIFISLAIIIIIFAKNFPRLKSLSKNKDVAPQKEDNKQHRFKKVVGKIGKGIKAAILAVLSWLVKNTKDAFSLIRGQFLRIKGDRNKNEKKIIEEIKNEYVGQDDDWEKYPEEEEKTEDDLRKQPESFYGGIETENKRADLMEETDGYKEEKIEQFFNKPEKEKEKPLSILKFFKKKEAEEDYSETPFEGKNKISSEGVFVEDEEGAFSDGIVRIERKPRKIAHNPEEKDNLIKEVVQVRKRTAEEVDFDEEIGVDRQILERKIIQKIAKDPRNIENYRQLGELYIKMKNYTDAEESYRQILKISPRDINAKGRLEKIKLLKRLR